MLNSYGYNRKTAEEDTAILAAVRKHHEEVEKHGFLVVMTVAIGSQNYDLDDEYSDIDTFSFIFPPLNDLAYAKEPFSGTIELEDGYCNIKDIRLGLNLLKKASPNSVEYFTSKYKIYNPVFEPILKEYLENNSKLWYMVHCNYKHMLQAIAGMAHQLTTRNMTPGKRFSHALRLDDMYYHFMNSSNANAVIEMRMGGDRDLALAAKRNRDETHDILYDDQCEQMAGWLNNAKNGFKMTEEYELNEQRGQALINSFQWKLFKKYLMETNK